MSGDTPVMFIVSCSWVVRVVSLLENPYLGQTCFSLRIVTRQVGNKFQSI